MLEFFRKYQRYFFIVVAVVIVISFSFFGTQATLNAPQKEKDYSVGLAVDGSKIMHSHLAAMKRLLGSDQYDMALVEKGIMPNFFNDGVIRKDLLGAGLGGQLAFAYFGELKEELEERRLHHQDYQPYVHPFAPFISLENLWGQILPSQKVNLDRFLSGEKEMTPDAFQLLVDLYLGESTFPPHMVREYLLFQEKHYQWVQPDPALSRRNLGLFHAASLEDWFGPKFVELAAQFVINGAKIAKERGYKVSYEEAKVALFKNGQKAAETQMRKEKVSDEEMGKLWHDVLLYLGMNEKEMVSLWQEVMLFRRLFDDVGSAVFVDPHLYQTFYGFASKVAEIDLYRLPDELRLSSFQSMLELEYYLDQVSKEREGLLLPKTFNSLSEIEKRCPELVEKRFTVEVGAVKKDDLALNVSLKEMWEWQLEKENYEALEEAFPPLALKKGKDAEGYFGALEAVDPELRKKIDRFSRGKIVEMHPEWIDDALNQTAMKRVVLHYSPKGKVPFEEEIPVSPELAQLLSTALIRGELDSREAAIAAQKSLERYTADQETFYRFHVLDRTDKKEVLTFAEAEKRGILSLLLENHLEKNYEKVRIKNPAVFKTEDSKWKPFEEVKNEVGRLLYRDLLQTIDKECESFGIALAGDRMESLDRFYPQHRLITFVHAAEKDIRTRLGESAFLLNREGEKPSLDQQWGLIKEFKLFKNHEKSPYFTSEVFAMVEKSWSEVALRGGALSFFQIKEKSVPSGNFSKEIKEGREILSREAKQQLMEEILTLLQEKGGISLTHDDPERS